MILAIEPAKYNKNFGIRIENDYIILKKGFRKF
jgi:Xaa-Pro aminopeptidase